ncbi:hypothetical protein B0181_03280 [Moraxella caviae]|uniref:Uncharacterized protein conserved in bacteria n=1 Tax=Moraxella caviae TaxID=34060 RepID=A0A1T0A6Y3_9GAMM|nr:hypothetical protein [Moraxella caviae]OOR91339.1 hypothetical protein B0181_03280 [Moraxella caviae]STZ13949.1 Uncharacterized protein conserved in bacteria [Moraxella caviae]VEW13010.1 Uncharacterized protein conserved in bacteria [Moraxella caviae]
MLTVLALAAAERLINTALRSDPTFYASFAPLSGKTLRVCVAEPELMVDVLFCGADDEAHLRFEPVARAIFENTAVSTPDCTLNVADWRALLALTQNPSGNLPISGDYRVLADVETLWRNFSPDVFMQFEALFGKAAGSYAYALHEQAKPVLEPLARGVRSELGAWCRTAADCASEPVSDADITVRKQELLRLQSDIEREEMRLAHIKAQIAKLQQDSTNLDNANLDDEPNKPA